MISKGQIETVLRINGYSRLSPEGEIRSVLSSARYDEDDIETAIMILRDEASSVKAKNTNGLHKIFRSDEGLKPSEISNLLNIDVDIENLKEGRFKDNNGNILTGTIVITIVAILIALIVVGIAMYFYEVGIFHPKASAYNI